MTIEELRAEMEALVDAQAPAEVSDSFGWPHEQADALLLRFVNDEAVTAAFDAIEKWYS